MKDKVETLLLDGIPYIRDIAEWAREHRTTLTAAREYLLNRYEGMKPELKML